MERGLAVWTDRAQRFYPTARLQARDNALIDADEKLSALDGRHALVYVDPVTDVPTCIYTTATHCSWIEGTLILNTGECLRGAMLYDSQGTIQVTNRPMQSLTCWYGYAFTFPGGEIYEG
jgi:hypothetical protein